MSLIKERKNKSTGAYNRILGNEKLDELISKIHATSISSGRELEKLILEHTNADVINDATEFEEIMKNKRVSEKDTYIIDKKILKSTQYSNKKEPDFIVIEFNKKVLNIIELKEGHIFDTKKVNGERQMLIDFSNNISSKVSYATKIFICSFHENNINEIYEGMKKEFKKEEIMNRDTFCSLLGIDYNKILEIRKEHAEDNFKYFVQEILKIPEIKKEALRLLENK